MYPTIVVEHFTMKIIECFIAQHLLRLCLFCCVYGDTIL